LGHPRVSAGGGLGVLIGHALELCARIQRCPFRLWWLTAANGMNAIQAAQEWPVAGEGGAAGCRWSVGRRAYGCPAGCRGGQGGMWDQRTFTKL
jgi:hypothetical protein